MTTTTVPTSTTFPTYRVGDRVGAGPHDGYVRKVRLDGRHVWLGELTDWCIGRVPSEMFRTGVDRDDEKEYWSAHLGSWRSVYLPELRTHEGVLYRDHTPSQTSRTSRTA